MEKTCARAVTLVLSIFVLLSLSPIRAVPAVVVQPYDISVNAHYRGNDFDVPIYLDGLASGYSTPHIFIGLTGYHNFSAPNEYQLGQFIQGPPDFQSDSASEFNLVAEGVNWILIGPSNATNSEGAIGFTYGSRPFVESFRDTYQPGSVASLGVEVHMSPNRVAEGHVAIYQQNWPLNSANVTPFYSSSITLSGAAPSFVQFQVPKDGPTGTWAYTVLINGTDLQIDMNCTFDVDYAPTSVSESFASVGVLPYTTFNVDETQYAMFQNSSTSPVVLYVGGGIIGDAPGLTPINGYSNVSDWNSATYRLIHDLVDNGFNVVTPSGSWHGLDFPSQLVSYLRGEGMNTFFAIGHSAGGFVIAHSIVSRPSLFSKAVIADAPLTEEATGYYFTDLSIRSGAVKIPHLLVWGRGDNQASLKNAYSWMDHANQSLAALAMYDYGHYWGGTDTEAQVRKQIVSFLTGGIAMGGTSVSSRLSAEPPSRLEFEFGWSVFADALAIGSIAFFVGFLCIRRRLTACG